MLRVKFRRVLPSKEAKLREWLSELNSRADEVRKTFVGETMRHEQAFILATSDGPILVYAMEADDFEQSKHAYAQSKLPIDIEHRRVLNECLGERLELIPLYNVSLAP